MHAKILHNRLMKFFIVFMQNMLLLYINYWLFIKCLFSVFLLCFMLRRCWCLSLSQALHLSCESQGVKAINCLICNRNHEAHPGPLMSLWGIATKKRIQCALTQYSCGKPKRRVLRPERTPLWPSNPASQLACQGAIAHFCWVLVAMKGRAAGPH